MGNIICGFVTAITFGIVDYNECAGTSTIIYITPSPVPITPCDANTRSVTIAFDYGFNNVFLTCGQGLPSILSGDNCAELNGGYDCSYSSPNIQACCEDPGDYMFVDLDLQNSGEDDFPIEATASDDALTVTSTGQCAVANDDSKTVDCQLGCSGFGTFTYTFN